MAGRNAVVAVAAGIAAVTGVAVLLAYRAPTAGAQDPPRPVIVGGLYNPVIGLVPGQQVRVSVVDPRESGCDTRRASTQARESDLSFVSRLMERDGRLLFVSDPTSIPEGGFATVDVNRDDLNTAGDPRTGRVEVGLSVELTCPHNARGPDLVAGWQVVDADSGQTATRGDVLVGKITPKGA